MQPLDAPSPLTPRGSDLSREDFLFVSDFVRRRAAIVLETGKEYLVETRLSQVVNKEGLDSVASLVRALRRGDAQRLESVVVEAMTTNETSFFRDLKPFDVLRAEVLPQLIQARRPQRRLSIWCAAASTGQEPYSVVMLLDQHFPELADWKIDFLATDISSEVLARASAGVYTQFEVNRGLPAPMLVKYFENLGGKWRLKPSIRQRVTFKPMNLIQPWPSMEPLDLIFARNVLIYFDQPTKSQILRGFRKLLRPDGVLFLGGAESTLGLEDAFTTVRSMGTSYYRVARAA
jgi:chemotaxis protein methyltransferase CheR